MKRSLSLTVAVLISLLLGAGCARQQAPRCTAPGDTPEQHYVAGMEALESARFHVAEERLQRAIYCDGEFSLPYGGLAIVAATQAAAGEGLDHKSAHGKKIAEYLKRHMDMAKTPEERFACHIAWIRVNTAAGGKGWLAETEKTYKAAKFLVIDGPRLLYYQGAESLDYFMGLARLKAFQFQKATEAFAAVMNVGKDSRWNGPADMAWKRADRVIRATAGTTMGDMGKRIAVKERVSRGELAALLADELNIGVLFSQRTPDGSPGKRPPVLPPDMEGPFRDGIMTALTWNVRGLELKYDEATRSYLFKPDDPVRRGEMAFVIEDVIIRISGDEAAAAAFLGHDKSPFSDVKPTSPYYNAVMNAASRGFMEGSPEGRFMVEAPVNGADVVLALRTLKQKINIR